METTNKPLDDLTRPIEENVFRARRAYAELLAIRDTLYEQGCKVDIYVKNRGGGAIGRLQDLPKTDKSRLQITSLKVY